jgi:hypothetical protein
MPIKPLPTIPYQFRVYVSHFGESCVYYCASEREARFVWSTLTAIVGCQLVGMYNDHTGECFNRVTNAFELPTNRFAGADPSGPLPTCHKCGSATSACHGSPWDCRATPNRGWAPDDPRRFGPLDDDIAVTGWTDTRKANWLLSASHGDRKPWVTDPSSEPPFVANPDPSID